MNQILEINDNLLDELVCGGLSRERLRAIIESLEAKPENWRACALAFLQEQAIAEELTAISQSNVNWESVSWDIAGKNAQDHSIPDVDNATEAATNSDSSKHVVKSNSKLDGLLRLQKITSMAALVLISFSIGWLGKQFVLPQSDGQTQTQAGVTSDPGPQQSLAAKQDSPDAPPPGQFIPDAQYAGRAGLEPQVYRLDTALPAEFEALQRSGRVELKTTESMVPFQLEDGSTALVPVQQVRIVPRGFSF